MTRRAFGLSIALPIALAIGYMAYNGRCLFTYTRIDVKLKSPTSSCTYVDLSTVSLLLRTPGHHIGHLGYSPEPQLGRESERADVLFTLPVVFPSEFEGRTDEFRIHFDRPPRVEGMEATFARAAQPMELYNPDSVSLRDRIRQASPGKAWYQLNRGRIDEYYDTDGRRYRIAGRYGRAVIPSPSLGFIALTSDDSGAEVIDSTMYLEIFRRRDQKRVARVELDTCKCTEGAVFRAIGWTSDQDFLMLTGLTSSELVACHFDK